MKTGISRPYHLGELLLEPRGTKVERNPPWLWNRTRDSQLICRELTIDVGEGELS